MGRVSYYVESFLEKIGLLFLFLTVIFCIGHMDGNAIVSWGVELLRHFRSGTLYFYATDLQLLGGPTNYGIFINTLNALALLPVFFFEVLGYSIPFVVYLTEYKIVIVIIFYFLLKSFKRIAEELSIAKENICDMQYVFCGSILIVFYAVAMGQVDLFSVLFLLWGIAYGLRERYNSMAFCLSLAVMVKAFPIFFCAPLFIYLFWRLFMQNEKKRFILCCFHFIWPAMLEKIIATVCMKDYFAYQSFLNAFCFIPHVMKISIFGCPVVALLMAAFLLIYFIRLMKKKAKGRKELLFWTCLMYLAFYVLVEWTPQYLIYGMLFFLLAAGSWGVNHRVRFMMFFSGVQAGLLGICVTRFNFTLVNAMLVSDSLAGSILHPADAYISTEIPAKWGQWIAVISYGLLYLCLGGIVFFSVKQKVSDRMQEQLEKRQNHMFWRLFYLLPVMIYAFILLLKY